MPLMADIAAEVCAKYGIEVYDLVGQSRQRQHVYPRQEFMWRAYQVRFANGDRRYSLKHIGRFLGNRDHSTVHHGINGHATRLLVMAPDTPRQVAW